MSLVLEVSWGILAITSPALTLAPSLTLIIEFVGNETLTEIFVPGTVTSLPSSFSILTLGLTLD